MVQRSGRAHRAHLERGAEEVRDAIDRKIERRTLDIPELAQVLGIGLRQAYEAARRDQLPVPVIRIGRRMVVSAEAVEQLLAARASGAAQ